MAARGGGDVTRAQAAAERLDNQRMEDDPEGIGSQVVALGETWTHKLAGLIR